LPSLCSHDDGDERVAKTLPTHQFDLAMNRKKNYEAAKSICRHPSCLVIFKD